MTRSSWFINFRPSPESAMRLYAFPYAGGSAAIFRGLAEALPLEIELWAANLPGHGSRLHEAPLAEMEPLVQLLVEALPDAQPFAFLGYSLGGRLAFELTCALRRRGRELPQHLFVAAAPAPHLPQQTAAWHTLPRTELLATLRQYNGLPQALLDEPEALGLLLPVLHADLKISADAVYRPEQPLALSIAVLGGRQDPLVSPDALEAWRDHTRGPFHLSLLDGDHFFIRTVEPDVIARTIIAELALPLFRIALSDE